MSFNNQTANQDCVLLKAYESESEVAQSFPTLCDPMDCSLAGSSIHGIFKARVLEWVGISFSNAWKWKVKVKSLSHVQLLVSPWTAAYQAPPSMGFGLKVKWHSFSHVWLFATPWTKACQIPLSIEFSRQEYLSGLPFPSPGNLPNSGIEPRSPAL